MPRSKGYRPKKEVREEVMALRAKLCTLDSSRWAYAGTIMQEIAALCGNSTGPMGGQVCPRACKRCKYFGHTSQRCPRVSGGIDMSEEVRIAARLEQWRQQEKWHRLQDFSYRSQVDAFDENGTPWEWSHVGALLVYGEGKGDGKWVWRGGVPCT